MGDELAERLKSHARSFDSLLSLIPAKLYHGEDVSDQWKRKKQTPEQKHAARLAKLDPDNWKSAKDVMDERADAVALKRRREENEDEAEAGLSPVEGEEKEQPKSKKRKVANIEKPVVEESIEDRKRRKAEERASKRERKRERKTKAKEKADRQKAKKREAKSQLHDEEKPQFKKKDASKELHLEVPVDIDVGEQQNEISPRAESPSPSTASSEEEPEEVFSPHHESGTSSTSSVLPPTSLDESINPQSSKTPLPVPATVPLSQIDITKTPQQRLQDALSQFRASRNADTAEPKSRQELLDQRRRKEATKKAAKKEQKRREKEEEARRQDEEIARRFSPGGSGSLLASPRSPIIGDNAGPANNFTFGRIAFADGTNFDPSTSEAVEAHQKKGPRDTASQLQIAKDKKSRLAGLDEEKRTQLEQKDMWLNAKKRAHGEHVRDDTSLLKKALKRQQTQKKKSEKEWGDRIEGVKKGQEMRQKKRNDNLAKRKEDKRGGKSSKGPGKVKVKRPGFEGSFKGRTGGGKKKS